MSSMSRVEDFVRNRGLRLTRQRLKILRTLFQAKNHLTADQIYEEAKENGIGLATVYRSLHSLIDIGAVKEVKIDGVSYYEPALFSRKPFHMHFRCSRCHDIIDLDDTALVAAHLNNSRDIEKAHGVRIDDADIIYRGLCSRCREEYTND